MQNIWSDSMRHVENRGLRDVRRLLWLLRIARLRWSHHGRLQGVHVAMVLGPGVDHGRRRSHLGGLQCLGNRSGGVHLPRLRLRGYGNVTRRRIKFLETLLSVSPL